MTTPHDGPPAGYIVKCWFAGDRMNPQPDDPAVALEHDIDPNEIALCVRTNGRVVLFTRAYVAAVESGHLASPNLYLSLAPTERWRLERLFAPIRRSA